MRFLLFAARGVPFVSLAAVAAVSACGGGSFQSGASDAGSVDSSVEASPEASSPPSDAGMYCSGRPETFCEDFDEYASLSALTMGATWPYASMTNGSFSFDKTNSFSPPNSLQVAGDDGAQVDILKTFAAPAPTRVLLSFELRVNSPGSVGLLSAAGFAAIAFGTSTAAGYVALAITPGPKLSAVYIAPSTTLDAGLFPPTATSMDAFPTLATWDSYTLEVDYNGGTVTGPCAQLYRGGIAQLSPCLPLPVPSTATKTLALVLGDVAGGQFKQGSVNLELDNVTFDIK